MKVFEYALQGTHINDIHIEKYITVYSAYIIGGKLAICIGFDHVQRTLLKFGPKRAWKFTLYSNLTHGILFEIFCEIMRNEGSLL